MRDNERNDDNIVESLYRTNRRFLQNFSDLANSLPGIPILKHDTQTPAEPFQGMIVADPVEEAICFYLGEEWICLKPSAPTFAIKVYPDTSANRVRNGAFKFTIPPHVDGLQLQWAKAFNGDVASGVTTVQVSNQTRGFDIFTTPLTIPSGAYVSTQAYVINTGGSINLPNHEATEDDRMWVDVDAVGSTPGKGLGLYLNYA